MTRGPCAAIAVAAVVGAFAVGPASVATASGALPVFDGLMDFGPIQGPTGAEEFSWEVSLGREQELIQIDDQLAIVYFAEGEHIAYEITPEPAHDAVGSTVPTSLRVSEEDVITLIVHHRTGNPAAGGEPFVYPVVAGPGWEGGFHTEVVTGPKDEQELREERERIAREKQAALEREWANEELHSGCLVPKLKGKSLKASKRSLRDGGCLIGDVRRLKSVTGTGKVVSQHPQPGRLLAPWATVGVTLAR